MKRAVFRVGGLALVVGALGAAPAHASTHVFVQIGAPFVAAAPVVAPVPVPPPVVAPVAVVPAPYPAYMWRPGYYVWAGYGYRWVAGGWVPRPYYARHGWERGGWGRWHGRGHWR